MKKQADTQAIIDELHGLPLTEQLAVLIGLIFSHVMAATTPDIGDQIVTNIARAIPSQWQGAKSMIQHGSLPH
jgi:hypothetical protein